MAVVSARLLGSSAPIDDAESDVQDARTHGFLGQRRTPAVEGKPCVLIEFSRV